MVHLCTHMHYVHVGSRRQSQCTQCTPLLFNGFGFKTKRNFQVCLSGTLRSCPLRKVAFGTHYQRPSLPMVLQLRKLTPASAGQVLYDFDFDWRHMVRGLTIDKRRGNVLKLDRHKYVKLAYHGFQKLSREQRLATYANALVRSSHTCFVESERIESLSFTCKIVSTC